MHPLETRSVRFRAVPLPGTLSLSRHDAPCAAVYARGGTRGSRRGSLRSGRGDATRFLLRQMLAHIDQVDATIERLDARIAELLRPMSDACALVTEIPGINATTVAGVLAEIGTDMSVFPSADHLVSWGGLAPGSHESAGKRKPAPEGVALRSCCVIQACDGKLRA